MKHAPVYYCVLDRAATLGIFSKIHCSPENIMYIGTPKLAYWLRNKLDGESRRARDERRAIHDQLEIT